MCDVSRRELFLAGAAFAGAASAADEVNLPVIKATSSIKVIATMAGSFSKTTCW
jgi:hypothetical protein